MTRELLILLLCTSSLAHAGQVFRWKDAQGNVTYSDQPPPASAKQSATLKAGANVVETDKETYEARVAREKNPVVLYSTTCGPVCEQAGEYLTQRGIPFTLKDPSREPEIALELKKLAGTLEVPVVQVGKEFVKGFEKASWGRLLDTAGYPKAPLVPVKPEAAKKP